MMMHLDQMHTVRSSFWKCNYIFFRIITVCTLIRFIQLRTPITFWKYNLIQHMLENHLDDGKLPPFPQKLRVSSHISCAEEESMGVELMKTMDYRSRYNLPNTNDIAPSHSEGNEESHGEEEGRKRTFSVLSQTSTTASRMPSYSKTLRM